ncbi:Gfo/Idh/MocA family protein [Thalassospira lucentensis]|uniref:Gfo/Idh/MocA family protein n=1 Tax=Thalassospira lucentensis TaxID=168935 RepID=UPI0009DC0EE2|nr:Gfo/Idh/MocA family oxidoreductase [Thalassospira lucentensis]
MGEVLISVGIVGCGEIAFGYGNPNQPDFGPSIGSLDHASAIREVGGFDVVACVDPSSEKLACAKTVFPMACLYRTLQDFRDAKVEVDMLVISSPTEYHEEALELAISQHIHAVFCEKPITDDPQASTRLVDKATAEGITISVNFLRLWDDSMAELRSRIMSGEFGELQAGTGVFVKDITHNGPHMIALLSDLLGPVVINEEVTCAFTRLNGEGNQGACASLSVAGANVTLNKLDHELYNFFEIELHFEKVVLRLEDGCRRIVLRKPVPHPEYTKLLYPEDISVFNGNQRMALANAWREWQAFFEHGTLMRRDINWMLSQEMICHQIKAMMVEKNGDDALTKGIS